VQIFSRQRFSLRIEKRFTQRTGLLRNNVTKPEEILEKMRQRTEVVGIDGSAILAMQVVRLHQSGKPGHSSVERRRPGTHFSRPSLWNPMPRLRPSPNKIPTLLAICCARKSSRATSASSKAKSLIVVGAVCLLTRCPPLHFEPNPAGHPRNALYFFATAPQMPAQVAALPVTLGWDCANFPSGKIATT